MKKYYYYFIYILCYVTLFIHNNKPKIISVIDPITHYYTNDYILCILIVIVLICHLLLKYKNKMKSNYSNILVGCFLTYCILLIIYSYYRCIFTFKWMYYGELCFFNIFGLLGVLLPLVYLNQLLLLIMLIGILGLSYMKQNILGYWEGVSGKQWGILLLLLTLYIFTTILDDILKNKKNQTPSVDSTTKNKFEEVPMDTPINRTMENSNKISWNERHERNQQYNKTSLNAHYINDIYKKQEDDHIEKEQDLKDELIKILRIFSIKGDIYKVVSSYTVTNYFFKPQAGIKMSRIESIEEEISMELGRAVRISSTLQGVVFEISNNFIKTFSFSQLWTMDSHCELPLFLGFDSLGEKVIIDLTKQPHILMCGTTGSGKSSTLHCLIHSLMTTVEPRYLKFIFIDPKILELSVYKKSKHLFVDIITDLEQANIILEELTKEMTNRYKIMSEANQRSIQEYNKKVQNSKDILPYLVCVIEEFADLALYKNNNFKDSVQRIAQMGRAAGLHLIIATQRPSANVIDGVIKANFPTRIALKVANKLESRIILDRSGGEKMERPGEMLLLDGSGILRRVIAPYISQEEIHNLMDFFIKST